MVSLDENNLTKNKSKPYELVVVRNDVLFIFNFLIRIMKKIIQFLAILFLFSGINTSYAAHLSESLLITAKLTGGQEVPPVTTSATGVASFRLNATQDTMCIDIITIGLSGPITGIHVHDGAMGMTGGAILDLSPFVNGNRVSAVITGSDLTPEKLAKYLTQQYYVNVHTTANAGGEIRGQLKLETDKGYKASMDANQQVHTVVSNAQGLGSFAVSLTGEKIDVKLITTGLSGAITAAHLHYGAPGMAGGVAVNLSTLIMGNSIVGSVDISAITGLIDSLKAGNVYVNIHTTLNAAGEIRGQLETNHNLYFDGFLDVNQQTGAVTGSNAKGVAIVEIVPTLDSVITTCLTDSLSGPITGAHLHQAAAGADGPVIINLSAGIMGNLVSSVSDGFTTPMLQAILTGGVYINIHTTLNASGETRAQLSRLAREGYTITLDGAQEVPSVTASGQGSGIVSIDRNRSNAHYMVVVSGLTDAITAAHFHDGIAGTTGGAIYDLSDKFNKAGTEDGAFGYWTELDATPFTAANEHMFRHDEIYVNIHTAANASGELRGQVLRGGTCMNVPTNTGRQEIFEEVTLFPNPVTDRMTLSMMTTIEFNGQLVISNILGQTLKVENITKGTDLSQHEINVSDLNTGLYILTIRNDQYDYSIRFVKK